MTKGKLSTSDNEMLRLEVVYKGRVQGVGFRFNVESIALSLDLTGWVMNEANGDVSVCAEGSRGRLNNLLNSVQNGQMGKYITKTKLKWLSHTGEFAEFKIEYPF